MSNILIVEDLTETAAWLSSRVESVFGNTVISVCGSVSDALKVLETKSFSIALLDINLPDGSGLSLIKPLKDKADASTVVMVTIYDDSEHVFKMLSEGADGYLLKDMAPERFEQKLEGISRGEPALSPAIARMILRSCQSTGAKRSNLELKIKLTSRESEVLTLLAKGLTRTEVARLLELSPNTIAKYVKEIYRKLQVSSRAEASIKACSMGLVPID